MSTSEPENENGSDTSDNSGYSSSSDSSGTETTSHDQSPQSSEDRSPRCKRVKLSDGEDIALAGNGFKQESLAGLVMFKQEILDGLVECKDLRVSFEEFPYYLSDITKNALVSASVHLKCKEYAKLTTGFTSLNPKILLSGPAGTEIYQEELAKALANHSMANFLTFDSREVLGSLTPAEIKSKMLQILDSQKTSDEPAGEGDASSPSNAPDSQLALVKAPVTPTFRDISGSEDLHELLTNALFQIVSDASMSSPLVLFFKDAQTFVAGNSCLYTAFQRGLEHLPNNVVAICSHIHSDEEDTGRQAPVSSKIRVPLQMLLGNTVSINSQQSIGRQVPQAAKHVTELFENDVRIECPQDENLLTLWNNLLDRDSKILQMKANTKQLHMMLRQSGFSCDGLDTLCLKDLTLDAEDAQKIVGWALSDHATREPAQDAKINFSLESMKYGIDLLKGRLSGSAFSKKRREEIAGGKEFMERLSSDVISPKNISEKFDDIGAIKNVKDALVEHVVVPFKMPLLFSKGDITQPYKGILLYGASGTGKTTLARAVAVEAKANLITISKSSIMSNKSIADVDKYFQAMFSLATKNCPCIILLDEVDSVLGERANINQEIKNLFIKHWRGLKRRKECVVLLAATSRPFELAESVTGEFCHRILIELPDAKSRSEILKVILRTTDLSDDVDLIQLGKRANGYSGKDIKKLCTAAASRRAFEIYNKRERGSALGSEGNDVRDLNMQDFVDALQQMGPSVSPTSESIIALLEWSRRHGGGRGSKDNDLGYFC